MTDEWDVDRIYGIDVRHFRWIIGVLGLLIWCVVAVVLYL